MASPAPVWPVSKPAAQSGEPISSSGRLRALPGRSLVAGVGSTPVESKHALSIVVPVLNEERTVLGVVDQLLSVDHGCDFEIIVVDDGSTDSTPELLAGFDDPRVRIHTHPTNFGKGAALRSGARVAHGTHMVPFDADGEYDAADLAKLMAPILRNKATVVYGSRIFGNNTVYQSYRYAMGNRALTLTANLLFDSYLTDMHTCLKVVPVELFRELRLRRTDFGLDTELTAALLRRGIRPFEIPISYHSRSHAEGKKIGWRDGVECLRVLVEVRTRRAKSAPTTFSRGARTAEAGR